MADKNADETVTPIIVDDDQRWIETVTASLKARSPAAREALIKALLDGEMTVTSDGHVSGLELDQRESGEKTALLRTHPVSGTTTATRRRQGGRFRAKIPKERERRGSGIAWRSLSGAQERLT